MNRIPTVHELAAWLAYNGYAEESSGYGHVGKYELAEALLNQFEMINKDKYFLRGNDV